MKERGIPLRAHEVRGILDGRQTQLRRVVRMNNDKWIDGEPYWNIGGFRLRDWPNGVSNPLKCPFGQPGDRLWVRETFRCNGWADDVATIFYRANERNSYTEMCEQFPVSNHKQLPVDGKWRPSIHMPRWASRITLEITGVRVERLQDISREDALAEGIERWDDTASITPYRNYRKGAPGEIDMHCSCPERSFMTLWESINGPGSWDENPWVWVIEFKRIGAEG